MRYLDKLSSKEILLFLAILGLQRNNWEKFQYLWHLMKNRNDLEFDEIESLKGDMEEYLLMRRFYRQEDETSD